MFDAVIVALLFGLLALEVGHRLLSFWQSERTWRLGCMLLVFTSLTVLFLVISLDIPLFYRNIVRSFLALGLAGSVYFGWRDIFAFMARKAARHDATGALPSAPAASTLNEPVVGTLVELAEHDGAKLEATAHQSETEA